MKKNYLSPEVMVTTISFEENILSNGEDLNVREYGSSPGEDADDFWI